MKYLISFNENMSLAKSIISKKMEAFDKLKNLLSNNLGYIGKFTQYLMEENVPYKDLNILYNDLVELKQKNVSIDISDLKYEELVDKIQNSNNDIYINRLINQFPSIQKNIAKELKKNNTNYNIMLKVSKKENLEAFISKVSRYKTKEELEDALKIASKDANNDIEYIKKYVQESPTSTIEFENNNILIVKIKDISDVKTLGSDTSWCILGDYNWSRYTLKRLQYILFDFNKEEFDPKFKIGFTLEYDGRLYAAHDILDTDVKAHLRKILDENGIGTISLTKDYLDKINIQTKSKIEGTTFTAKTTINTWKDLIDMTNATNVEEVFIKFLDAHNMKYNKERKIVINNLTEPRMEIVSILIRKVSNMLGDEKGFVSIDSIKTKDERILYYLKINDKLIDKNSISSKFGKTEILKYFDIFSQEAFVGFIRDSIFRIFGSSWGSSNKTLKYDIETLTKIFDKIDTDKIDTKDERFIKNYAFLSKLIGRNTFQEYLDVNSIAEYNNNFKEQIDLSKLDRYTINKLNIDNFDWASYIIKKDYNLNYKIHPNAIILNNIFNQLEGYNVSFKFNKFSDLAKSIREKHNRIDNKFLKSLPLTSRKKIFISEDGKHILNFGD
jgi:hypothetical protein